MNPPPPTVAPVDVPAKVGAPAPPPLRVEHLPPFLRTPAPPVEQLDDWPHTTRVLPWMLAGFMAVLWLVPFNTISMRFTGPVDFHFDRIVLPFILVTWLLTLAVGGRAAPRIRLTPIHGMVGLFVAIAFLSVVLDGPYLSQTLALGESVKKLSLLVSYVLVFLMVSSTLRPGELRPFLTYTFALGVLCAVGTLWEYHFHQNLFYQWSGKLLPGKLFIVQQVDPTGFDPIGRRIVRGPAELSLECAAMLSMAMPVAIVRLMQSTTWRKRIGYALATCVILAATAATYRKTAIFAPAVVLLTIGYFRRRELLRLAPLGLVALVFIHVLAPGALGGVSAQLSASRLGAANTVDDRTTDYDAIRPDVFSHLLLGSGYGSYEQTRERILDSEVLHRLIEVGVLGLAAYFAMIGSVIAAMRGPIRSRRPERAPPALICAAAAAAFLAVSFLFDAMSFPHAPYIFLTFAAFAAVIYNMPETPQRTAI
jgi:hypothetical protein